MTLIKLDQVLLVNTCTLTSQMKTIRIENTIFYFLSFFEANVTKIIETHINKNKTFVYPC